MGHCINSRRHCTLYTPGNTKNIAHARRVKTAILQARTFKARNNDALTAREVMRKASYSFSILKGIMYGILRPDERLFRRLTNAYTDGRIFSVELVAAVTRQNSFVGKMYDLKWTQPGAFETIDEEVVLWHAIARYHAFLDLMSGLPIHFLVPTLDIDLAWHTHQLRSYDYYYDTKKYVGSFIDHDDKVEETHLSNSFDTTASAWRSRFFGVQYTYC
ncbi:hypothetical protein MIND_00931500 [Mycena indigotica]|uniref:Uncharacterized protein n=1 Tax=Mycena indigotica TaxID=2126181 RepID=A0A8H6SDK7_9AGAR|nr:uncharacterized protein MIND_00931500 [Mycena indigotica]KAF7296992.1 hypothetical protein MIND_00931500 [Mycena indigotica]